MVLGHVLAGNLLPALALGLVLLCLLQRPLSGTVVGFALAAGYLLGVALVGTLGWLTSVAGMGDNPIYPTVVLSLLAGAAGVVLLRRNANIGLDGAGPVESRIAWWWYVLAALMLLNLFLMAHESMVRPVYPWDAWSAWLVKSRVWLEQGSTTDFVSFPVWLAAGRADLYTTEAWQYPELIPRFQLWLLQWDGQWDERIALSPWLFTGAALTTMSYCGLRLLQVAPHPAMGLTFFIAAIPILNVQIALPGLMDLWIAAELLLFSILTLLWIQSRRTRWLLLALAVLVMVAGTKLEGLVWACLLAIVLFFGIESRNTRRTGVLVIVAALVSWWVTGGFAIQLTPALSLTLTPQLIELPYLGRFEVAFSNQFAALAKSFLGLPNWHLAWYVLLPGLGIAAVRNWRLAEGRALIALAAVCLGFTFVLFFLTHAGMWAQSMTASNRIALHFVPALLVWGGFLLWRSPADLPAIQTRR